jgi:hypothetical protein
VSTGLGTRRYRVVVNLDVDDDVEAPGYWLNEVLDVPGVDARIVSIHRMDDDLAGSGPQ